MSQPGVRWSNSGGAVTHALDLVGVAISILNGF